MTAAIQSSLASFQDKVCPVCDAMREEPLGRCADQTFPECEIVGTDREHAGVGDMWWFYGDNYDVAAERNDPPKIP